ncbi:hypothetical protein DPMN_143224 [Dreissena polymorpha]|uniref:CCHC-type domain-containing protein n=1 Tax=Dreissena polymorpha TaxID=45954 RepID=A0A9D4JJW4_DREPO|nr:hypothetical protein DPMN_143224 [Dreissena polymorpha]
MSDHGYHASHHGNSKRLPKNLRFDGKGSWLAFKQKFESYRRVGKWTDGESRDYLNWCLDGKALDFFAISTQMGENYSFKKIMRKLEGRFGAKELPETSRAKFQQESQKADEALEDWADRVLTLATPAFRHLPEKHCSRKAISKFCQGCIDKESGKHACFEQPRTIQEALDKVRHHQYITQAIDGKRTNRSKAEPSLNTVQSETDSRFSQLEKAIQQLSKQLEKLNLPKNDRVVAKAAPPKKRAFLPGVECFFCHNKGHVQPDCRRVLSELTVKSH